MVMLDEGKQKAGDIAKDELNQSGSTNAAVNMAISGLVVQWITYNDGWFNWTSKGSW